MKPRRRWSGLARVLSLTGAVALASACHEPLDTTRVALPSATFGDDVFGAMCDRLGAAVLSEDLAGASYHALCHYDADGRYADTVDTSVLPPTSGSESAEARRVALAKLEALARRRAELVRALNATFPDRTIPNPATDDPDDEIALLDALLDFGQRVSRLYEENPYSKFISGPDTEPLAPAATRALGRLLDSMATSDEALSVLTRTWGRRGYRPSTVGLGVVRSSLDYPELRAFGASAASLLGTNGVASPELDRLLRVTEAKLANLVPETSALPELTVDGATAQPSRPRTTIELARELMLTQDDRFAPTPSEPPRFIALRDRRGFVAPSALQGPFADGDGDGYADVDAFGRFVDSAGAALLVDAPFAIPGVEPTGPVDGFGRPQSGLYRYVDTARTPAAGLSGLLVPLLDATRYAEPGDPEAYTKEYETLMYALAGAYALLGPREEVEYDFANDVVVPAGTGCASCAPYKRFNGSLSPVADLAHAAGQVLADPESDAMLLGVVDLLENHEPAVARVVAAMLRVKEIADAHDVDAAKGLYPPAGLPYENPIWDEMAQVLGRIADRPGLFAKLLGAMADPVVVSSIGGSAHLGETVSLYASTRDELTYDPSDLNGAARNLTDGGFSTGDPNHLVDWNAPRNGKNRSVLERSLLLIHDTAGAKSCNKGGAKVKANVLNINLTWPLSGSYDPCELFEIPNLAAFYFGALVPPSHPKRSQFVLKDGALNSIMDLLGGIASPDEVFEKSSGITGMTTRPSPAALNRLVFFGASSDDYPNLPDHDVENEGGRTDTFIYNLMEPIGTSVCPTDPQGVGVCQENDLIRLRGRNSIFAWERRGFLDYLKPVVRVFVDASCNDDVTFCDKDDLSGEQLFLDLSNTFYRHYPGPDHGPECEKSGSAKTNPRYCSEAGLNRYEPILEKALRTDLIPALHELSVASHELSKITIARGPKAGQVIRGSDVLEQLARVLFSTTYAANSNLRDRAGGKQATWTDGTVQGQLTGFTLFADALHRFDTSFDGLDDGAERKAQWRRARSQLVDAFLATEGTGDETRFANRALVPLLASTVRLFREQLNAHCPDRESGGSCVWAKTELGEKVADGISSPLFSSLVDLGEQLRKDDRARRELERFLTYLLESAGTGESLQGTLASMVDVLQVLADDAKVVPILRAASVAAKLVGDPEGAGAADTSIRVLQALTSDEFDRYHVLSPVLANLVTPMQGEDGAPGLSPLEVYIDVIAEVNRLDPSRADAPLAEDDYAAVLGVVRDFLVSDTRGLEQIYAIVEKRKRP
jgi:hypothetical protein